MAFNVDGVDAIKFGATTGIKAQQADNKIGTIGFNFSNNPEKMLAASNYLTDSVNNGNAEFIAPQHRFLGSTPAAVRFYE